MVKPPKAAVLGPENFKGKWDEETTQKQKRRNHWLQGSSSFADQCRGFIQRCERFESHSGLASDVAHSVYKWLDAGVVTAYAKSVSFGENSCPAEGVTAFNDTEEFRWMGRVAAGKTIEIKGINGAVSLAFPLTRQRTVGPKHVSGRNR